MKNKVVVTAQAFDPKTGKALAEARDELIDLKGNLLFKGAKTLKDIHNKYESFWNDIDNPAELVFVQKISWK